MGKPSQTSFERRIEILFYIIRTKNTTIPELAHMFSVCEKTIYTDIVFLSRYAPIYTKSGTYGGIFILDTFKSDLFLYLTKDEEKLLEKLSGRVENEREKMLLNRILNRYAMPVIVK